jgi:hypothetical protein
MRGSGGGPATLRMHSRAQSVEGVFFRAINGLSMANPAACLRTQKKPGTGVPGLARDGGGSGLVQMMRRTALMPVDLPRGQVRCTDGYALVHTRKKTVCIAPVPLRARSRPMPPMRSAHPRQLMAVGYVTGTN